MALHTSPDTAKRLLDLSDQLRRAASEIALFHRVKEVPTGQSTLCEDEKAPLYAPLTARKAEELVVEVTSQLQRLMNSPGKLLLQKAIDTQHLACLRWLCHFDVPSRVPMGSSVAYEEVAKAANVPVSQLQSVARMAMTIGFLEEIEDGELSHTSLSKPFAADPSLKDWVLFIAEASASCAFKSVEATERWGLTEAKNKTAYNIAMNTDLPFFEYLATDQRLTKQFAGYMKNLTKSPATSLDHVAAGFDWASLGEGTVVDVGGSSGHASIAVAKQFPALKFVVQDLETTIQSSAADLSTLSPSISNRISFASHDFFTAQPITGASVYFMRTIIHDWPKTEACQILGHLAKAMTPNGKSRLLIMDIVLPRPGSALVADESLSRLRDVTMTQIFNAKERELSDWTELIAATGEDLVIQSVSKPFGSSLSVIEVIRKADETANGAQTMAADSKCGILGQTVIHSHQVEPYPAMV